MVPVKVSHRVDRSVSAKIVIKTLFADTVNLCYCIRKDSYKHFVCG